MDRKTWKLPVTLCLVSMVMAFLICGVYILTKDRIDERAAEAQQKAQRAVLPAAVSLESLPVSESDPVDLLLAGYDALGAPVGYVSQITVIGFGGEIEVTVGMDMSGSITAIRVGGANFSETSGLGAKTRDAAFTDQFAGKSGLLALKQNIDSVTGASISSGAVVGGVNAALNFMTAQLPQDETAPVEELPLSDSDRAALLPCETLRFMGAASGIDGWWQGETGYVVQATGYGRGPICIKMAFNDARVCVGIVIGDENFVESDGYGAKLLDPAFWQQFLLKTGAQSYGNGVDAISGATSSSNGALSAINACMTFDPATAQSAPAEAAAQPSAEVSAKPAQSTAASTEVAVRAEAPASQQPTVTTVTVSDAVSMASTAQVTPVPTPTPDAVSEASVVEPAATATPVPTPDAVSEASVTEVIAVVTPTPTPMPTPAPTPAAVFAPDAVSEASTITTPPPTPQSTPDAVTEASVTED